MDLELQAIPRLFRAHALYSLIRMPGWLSEWPSMAIWPADCLAAGWLSGWPVIWWLSGQLNIVSAEYPRSDMHIWITAMVYKKVFSLNQ